MDTHDNKTPQYVLDAQATLAKMGTWEKQGDKWVCIGGAAEDLRTLEQMLGHEPTLDAIEEDYCNGREPSITTNK